MPDPWKRNLQKSYWVRKAAQYGIPTEGREEQAAMEAEARYRREYRRSSIGQEESHMRAITLYQPYGLFIVTGAKKIETRPRRTHIRGTIAIHAALKPVGKVLDAMPGPLRYKILRYLGTLRPTAIHYGAVIGTVDIVDCVPVEQIREELTEQELTLGNYEDGRWAWILENPVKFDRPFWVKGRQGWFDWRDEREQANI